MSAGTDAWEARCENWAKWVLSGNGRSSAVSSVYRMGVPGFRGRSEMTTIVLVGDALDTDALVRRLNQDLQRALLAWYVWTGTIREKAGRLSIHENTLKYRVQSARMKLADLDGAQRARAARMRQQLAAGAAR